MAQKPPLNCFACNRPMWADRAHNVVTCDGQRVEVGPECFRRIERTAGEGWQPPSGAPRLYRYGDI